jgi:hypothetical protein
MKETLIACIVSAGYALVGIIVPYATLSWLLFFNAAAIFIISLFWQKIIEIASKESFCEIPQTVSFMPQVCKNKRGFFYCFYLDFIHLLLYY